MSLHVQKFQPTKEFLLIVVVQCVLLSSCVGFCKEVLVWPNCNNNADFITNISDSCTELNNALQSLTSDTTLFLQPGEHVITKTHNLNSFSSIEIVGSVGITKRNDKKEVIVTCSSGYGLSFVNISDLRLAQFTINHCGMEGFRLSLASLKENIDLFFDIPLMVKVALFLGDIENIQVEDMLITNTTGLGLVGVNLIGNSSLIGSEFSYNRHAKSCYKNLARYPFTIDSNYSEQIGGGAYILYVDYNQPEMTEKVELTLANNTFRYNSDCSFAGLTQVNFQYYTDQTNTNYTIGAGGGLSVFAAQCNYYLNISVSGSLFYGNGARYGGGMHIGLFVSILDTNVRIVNCTFMNNGELQSDNSKTETILYSYAGAGLAIFTDLLRPQDILRQTIPSKYQNGVNIYVEDSEFLQNRAGTQGGGVFGYFLFNERSVHKIDNKDDFQNFNIILRFHSCLFRNNIATYGAGASFYQRINHGIDGALELVLSKVSFEKNGQILEPYFQRAFIRERERSALDVRNLILVIIDELHICQNKVSGMLVHSSYILLKDRMVLDGNVGHLGGGIHFRGDFPVLFMSTNSKITFNENYATLKGGAIYYDDNENDDLVQPLNFTDCFIFFDKDIECNQENETCNSLHNLNVRVEFSNNSAPLGGMIFGLTLMSCPWEDFNIELEKTSYLSYYQLFYNEYPNVFVFDEEPHGSQLISTEAAFIQATPKTTQLFPGEEILLSIRVLDSFHQAIPSAVTSFANGSSNNVQSSLGDSKFWFVTEESPESPLVIMGSQRQTVSVTVYTTNTLISNSGDLTFDLLSCPLGFTYNESSSACACFSGLRDPVVCSVSSLSLTVSSSYWIGPRTMNISKSNSSDLVIARCVLSYCGNGERTFRPPNFDSQCAHDSHMTGVLCGACKPGYSRMFGSQDCGECENYYLFLIFVFGIAGILLFIAITYFGITIDKGWISVILLYSNIQASLYLTRLHPMNNLQYLFLPASLISLEIGIPLCFFNGMTSIHVVALQLAFPLYLVLLMIMFALLCRCYSKILSYVVSPVKVLVTVMIMSYISILNTCIEILGVVVLHSIGNVTSVRWILDPNKLYFRGEHTALGVLAILLLLFYIIPFSTVLFFPTFAYKCFKKYKPFLDAFWSPYKEKYRFWLAVRLQLRALLLTLIYSIPGNEGTLISGAVILLVFSHTQLALQPFKEKWINVIDSFMIGNIIISKIFSLYTEFLEQTHLSSLPSALNNISVIVFLCLGYIIFLAIFVLHLVMKFPVLKSPKLCFMLAKRKLKVTKTVITIQTADEENVDDSSRLTIDQSSRPPSRSMLSVRINNISRAPSPIPIDSPVSVNDFSQRGNLSRLRESLLSGTYVLTNISSDN